MLVRLSDEIHNCKAKKKQDRIRCSRNHESVSELQRVLLLAVLESEMVAHEKKGEKVWILSQRAVAVKKCRQI